MSGDIVHRASWGYYAIRGGEFTCCHGSQEKGHSPHCPYDKNIGPMDFSKLHAGPGIDFHQTTMAQRHGPDSAYAKNLRAQAETRVNSPTVESEQAHSPQALSSAVQFESGHSVLSPRGRKSKAAADSRQATLLE